MPHSPFSETVYAPILDVDEYRRELAQHRASWENDESNEHRDQTLLDIGELLVEHCDFLEAMLNIKRREYGQLAKYNDTLKKNIEALVEESDAQIAEITVLKSELETTTAATETEEQLGSNGDGTWVEVNSQDLNAQLTEAEKPEEGGSSLENAEMANLRKRGTEVDAAVDDKATKKGKTQM
ncbi:MAG: hypothetical protein Q9167_007469 [Letrouitia subvulpina]